jgi:hypothetical protein
LSDGDAASSSNTFRGVITTPITIPITIPNAILAAVWHGHDQGVAGLRHYRYA